MTDGKRANKNGLVLEKTLVPVLIENNFKVFNMKDWAKVESGTIAQPSRVALKNKPFTTIYGTEGKTEFCLIADGAKPTMEFPNCDPNIPFECRVECKRQEVPGSVDEKFPHLIISAEEAYPEKHVILLMEVDDGARVGAVDWLKKAVELRKFRIDNDKEVVMLNISGFLKWVGRAFG